MTFFSQSGLGATEHKQIHQPSVCICYCCSVAMSCLTLCDPMDCSTPSFLVLHYLPECSNSCPLNQWCHPTILSSVIPFASCFYSFLASGSFLISQLFASGGQRIGVSASTSVLPMTTQHWFPLGWSGLISLLSKGLSRVFSNTTKESSPTPQKH